MNIFSVAEAVVVGVAEVEAGPEDPSLLRSTIETVLHAVAVYNINCIVLWVLLRVCEYFVDRSGHVRLTVILEISRVSVHCVITLPIRDEGVKVIAVGNVKNSNNLQECDNLKHKFGCYVFVCHIIHLLFR